MSMRTALPLRSLVGSVPCALAAMLLVLLRLLAPAMAMPAAGPALIAFDRVARDAICHVAPDKAGDPADETPAGQADCLQCPACHLSSVGALPLPLGPAVPIPATVAVGLAAVPPPATGPPGRLRGSAHPTGPPAFSA